MTHCRRRRLSFVHDWEDIRVNVKGHSKDTLTEESIQEAIERSKPIYNSLVRVKKNLLLITNLANLPIQN